MAIQLTEAQQHYVLKTIQACLSTADIYLFGSRVKGLAKQYADLDVLIMTNEPIPLTILSDLNETFSESDLPFKVDIVDWHRISPAFRAKIKNEWVKIS